MARKRGSDGKPQVGPCLSQLPPGGEPRPSVGLCLSLPAPVEVPDPGAAPCLSVPPSVPVDPRRGAADARETLAGLKDRLPVDVQARLGLTGREGED